MISSNKTNAIEFKTKYDYYLNMVNTALTGLIIEKDSPEKSIYKAMNYSLMAGGKRLRPILTLAIGELLDASLDEIMPYCLAIEMIHTYSLIHDDLPSMDNDDYRRGRLTNHKVFGQAKAILAGDALLNYAFEYMLQNALNMQTDKSEDKKYNIEANVKAMSFIAQASGVNGMIGGQVVDIESEGIEITQKQLEYIHKKKTGALIKAAIMVPAILEKVDNTKKRALERYSANIGLAFQVKDDILDLEGDFKLLGKDIGKDENISKSTYISLYGIDVSREILRELIDGAVESLEIFDGNTCFLKDLAHYIAEREI